ncbi:MAG: RNase adapter RapZ, partial [Microthrixaceae bacterium]|nr:RNase adapter RapZ [Microthrixaceae bacterium]
KGSADEVALPVAELKSTGARVQTIFMDASTANLIRRYGESKRRHPLLGDFGSVEASIAEERMRLQPLRAAADMIIDTTDMNVHELRRRVHELFADRDRDNPTQVTVMSFGFKYGVPTDADMVIDCRFLPNPHWIEELRPMTGLDAPVSEYVESFDLTKVAIERIEALLELLVPAYVDEGKSVFTVAFGCTGGRHRSVAIAERIVSWMRESGYDPRIRHRDVEK